MPFSMVQHAGRESAQVPLAMRRLAPVGVRRNSDINSRLKRTPATVDGGESDGDHGSYVSGSSLIGFPTATTCSIVANGGAWTLRRDHDAR